MLLQSTRHTEPLQPQWLPSLLGSLDVVTAAATQVVSTADAKTHCRVEISDDDTYIGTLVQAAQRWCESGSERGFGGDRQFLTATYSTPVIGFWQGPLKLPRPPLQSVSSVKYYATDGVLTTLATDQYIVRTPWRGQGTVERAPLVVWPVVQPDRRFPVVIQFVCGYGAASTVPATIVHAIKLLVGHWYERREPVVGGIVSKEIAFTVNSLLEAEGYGCY